MIANGKTEHSAPSHFDVSLVEALRRKECAIMRRREIECDILAGKLVNAAEVEAEVRQSYRTTAQRLLQLPSKLAPRLAAMRVAVEIESLMRREFEHALNSLSDEAAEKLRKSEAKAGNR